MRCVAIGIDNFEREDMAVFSCFVLVVCLVNIDSVRTNHILWSNMPCRYLCLSQFSLVEEREIAGIVHLKSNSVGKGPFREDDIVFQQPIIWSVRILFDVAVVANVNALHREFVGDESRVLRIEFEIKQFKMKVRLVVPL